MSLRSWMPHAPRFQCAALVRLYSSMDWALLRVGATSCFEVDEYLQFHQLEEASVALHEAVHRMQVLL